MQSVFGTQCSTAFLYELRWLIVSTVWWPNSGEALIDAALGILTRLSR